jgi:D-beta-D-heptose 7-phosphate kinase/D-beta-D-heptose 1-phosphate adenosyltransferase
MQCRSLVEYMDHFANQRIAVVGDLMLDRYIWGRADRISQEAPVPVVRVRRETETPGGAANVVMNIHSLGGQACVFGVVGADAHGRTLTDLLRNAGVDVDGVAVVPDRPTTVKTRVLAGGQQVCRVDREEEGPLDPGALRDLEQRVEQALTGGRVDALIFEDYAKGLLGAELVARLTERARACGVPAALDPHPSHPLNVHGLTLMTPNRHEAFGLAGHYAYAPTQPVHTDKTLIAVGEKLLRDWDMEHLLVTLGGDGMALFHRGENGFHHIPTRAREVYDVSGAGDTVMASFVMALLAGAGPVQAAHISNHAAGIVVGKVGTVAVQAEELRHELEREQEADEH